MEKKIKRIEVITKALLIFFCFFACYVILFKPEHEIFCFGKQIDHLIFFSPLILAIILAIALEITVILIRRRHKLSTSNSIKTFLKFLAFSLIFYLFVSLIFSAPGGQRGKAIDARKKADLIKIHQAQEMFYSNKGRYAVSLEELFRETGEMNIDTMLAEAERFNIIFQEKEDPKTWEAYTYLREYCIEICSSKESKVIYICDEKGCREDVLINTGTPAP